MYFTNLPSKDSTDTNNAEDIENGRTNNGSNSYITMSNKHTWLNRQKKKEWWEI